MRFGLFGLLFPDCVPDSGDDTGGPTYEAELTQAGAACNADRWVYSFLVDGSSSGVRLEIFGDDWDEAHSIPDGVEENRQTRYELDLLMVFSTEAWVSGENTLFSCPSGEPSLNWKVDVVDGDGNLAECWVSGVSPESLGFEQCGVWEEFAISAL